MKNISDGVSDLSVASSTPCLARASPACQLQKKKKCDVKIQNPRQWKLRGKYVSVKASMKRISIFFFVFVFVFVFFLKTWLH